jgi:thiamine pyrophosphokinase
MRTFIVAGSPEARPPDGFMPGPEDRVIAADRGAQHAVAWGWPVHLLVGDPDSLPESETRRLLAAGVAAITAPRAKDETDLELALAYAVEHGAREIIICGALGGRTDHMLGNILLLARSDLSHLDVKIAEAEQTLQVLRGPGQGAAQPDELILHGKAGDLLSLLPVGGDAMGVTTGGLLYPLRDESLLLGRGRGISNVFEASTAWVRLRAGVLLVIQGAGGEESGNDPID